MQSNAETPGHHCKLGIRFLALAELTQNLKPWRSLQLASPFSTFTCCCDPMRPPSLQAEVSSLLAQSGLTLRNGRVAPHKKEPLGTLGLCSVAAWHILAEVFRTRSMEGRPQGGGSSYHLRWEELGVVMGAKDIRSTWLSYGSRK